MSLTESYSTELQTAYSFVQDPSKLPELFCTFTSQLQDISPDIFTPEIQTQVKEYFQDVNKRIEQYNEQYEILLQELGVLCSEGSKSSIPSRFFQALLDFFRLAYSLYEDQPEKLQVFYPLLQQLTQLLQTGQFQLKGEPLEKALLFQLTTSAWVYSHTNQSMQSVAKQIGGAKKNKTRKQKHKH
jgi:hypothetical protein